MVQVPCLKPSCAYALSEAHPALMVKGPFPCRQLQGASDHTILPKLCNPDVSWASLTFQVFSKIWTELQFQALGWLEVLPEMPTPACSFILLFIRQLLSAALC